MNSTLKFFIGIACLFLIGLLLFEYGLVTLTIAGGFISYFMIEQIVDVLRRKGLTNWQAYTVLSLLFVICAISFMLYVSIPFFEELEQLGSQLPTLIEHGTAQLSALKGDYPFIDAVFAGLKTSLENALHGLLGHSASVLTSLITIPIITFTLLFTSKELEEKIYSMIPNEYFEVTVTIANRIVTHVKDYVGAKGIESFAMAVLYAIGFSLIGLPQSLLLSITGAFLNIVPYLGPLITAVPVGLVAFAFGGWKLFALSMLVLALARLIDDAILQTVVLSHYVDVHPIIVVLATLIGGEVLGPIGLIVAIPIFVITKLLVVGLYDVILAIERRELLLNKEEKQKEHAA